MLMQWIVAAAVFACLLLLLPYLLRRTKRAPSKGGGSGVMLGIGLVFAMIFDPRAAQATEIIDQARDESDDEESGDKT
ncbi:MAG TPA: hypothetical protein VNB28_02170 [Methylomirabilota bacterium]|nr:hypothetical protein [Methylomirabilota bacterium]